jgi:hypothetical protein
LGLLDTKQALDDLFLGLGVVGGVQEERSKSALPRLN